MEFIDLSSSSTLIGQITLELFLKHHAFAFKHNTFNVLLHTECLKATKEKRAFLKTVFTRNNGITLT